MSLVFINKKYKGDVNFYPFDLKRKENNAVFFELNYTSQTNFVLKSGLVQ